MTDRSSWPARAPQIRALFRGGIDYHGIDRRLGGVDIDEFDAATRILRIQMRMEAKVKRRANVVRRGAPDPDPGDDIEPIDVMFQRPLRASRRRSREEEDA